MAVTPGRVVVLNGTSSAGKTTLARRFREDRAAVGDCWLVIALDDFHWLMPHQWFSGGGHHGERAEAGVRFETSPEGVTIRIGELGRRLFAAYRRTAAEWARQGFNVLVDDVCFDADAVGDWKEALAGLSVTWVAVRCDLEMAEAREAARLDRVPGLARGLGVVVHRHAPVDIELDTTTAGVAETAATLASIIIGEADRLPVDGPRGTVAAPRPPG